MKLSTRALRFLAALLGAASVMVGCQEAEPDGAFHRAELLFPFEEWHNHGSSVVELADGSLIASWFHGSGERQADDVAIFGARWTPGGGWSEPFVMADTPGFPDTNCTLLVDRQGRLWLFWPTILDNRWEGALLKLRMSENPTGVGTPSWDRSEVLHMKPGEEFPAVLAEKLEELTQSQGLEWEERGEWPERTRRWVEASLDQASDKLTRRLGWFTRAHPYVLRDGRILVGLYSDGFSVSSLVYSDDAGASWTMSEPIVGAGNVQPSFAERRDGTVVAFMRDNGPPPKRVLVAESKDRGESWSLARDHEDLVESGAGNEVLVLRSGRWLVVHNDVERGRHRLAVSVSDDEGRTFQRARVLEEAEPESGRFHYPSIIQASDGTLHVTYSIHLPDGLGPGVQGKSIKHAWFNEAWLFAEEADDGGTMAVGVQLRPTVVLVSLDGFRWDYLQRPEAVELRRFATEGVSAPRGIVPAFPTKTFPSHYSIATGLYPQNHGIVANTMYDPEWDAWFRIGDRTAVEDGRWWGGEPIWVTAERQGQVAATFFWVGSEAPVGGQRPTYWKRFDGDVPGEERVDTVLEWLRRPVSERPTLVTLYLENTDNAGHDFGPESKEVGVAIAEVDALVGRLRRGLESSGLWDQVNVVVTADHGMSALSKERVVVLSDLVNLESDDIVSTVTPVLAIRPPAGRVAQVYEALHGAHPKLDVYLREESPPAWRFRDHRRIAPIVGLVADGWRVVSDQAGLDLFKARGMRGDHGFDNRADSMAAVFVARGPAFRRGMTTEPFASIHLYELLCSILGLDPAPNDGSLAKVRHLLAAEPIRSSVVDP